MERPTSQLGRIATISAMEERIIELEERVAYQEKLLRELDDAFFHGQMVAILPSWPAKRPEFALDGQESKPRDEPEYTENKYT